MPFPAWMLRPPPIGCPSLWATAFRSRSLGQPVDKDHQYGSRWMSISPGYLEVFKIPVLRGRNFNENDKADAPAVALINEAMAKRYWPGKDPVGQQIAVSKGLGPELNESSPDDYRSGWETPTMRALIALPIRW